MLAAGLDYQQPVKTIPIPDAVQHFEYTITEFVSGMHVGVSCRLVEKSINQLLLRGIRDVQETLVLFKKLADLVMGVSQVRLAK
jgi:hypothetical protein